MSIKKTSTTEIIKELGLPEGSKCLGYVVHLPNEDEFLAYCKETHEMTQRAFSKTPNGAKVYKVYKKALRDAKGCNQKAETYLLFDIGSQLIVAPVE